MSRTGSVKNKTSTRRAKGEARYGDVRVSASPLAPLVEVVLFFTYPVQGIFGVPFLSMYHLKRVTFLG